MINNYEIKMANELFVFNNVNKIRKLMIMSAKDNLNGLSDMYEFVDERIKLMDESLKNKSAIIFYAENSNNLLGFIWSYLRNSKTKEIHITDLVVDGTYQNQHIGSNLIIKLEEYCLYNHLNNITLMATSSNNKVLDFYSKRGFKEERRLLRKVVQND